jgi:NitT/TauT family transport system ATP-binding protein
MMGADFIEINNLRKEYKSARGRVLAVEDVKFSVSEGEFVVIVGPSGCGKSTLLKIVAGLLPFDQGHVKIGGKDIKGPARDVGLLFQNPVLFPWKTVIGNVLAPIELMGFNKKDYLQRAHELIDLAKLSGFEHKYPMELSGGMQQRVAICRALIYDPKVILMDEPFGALDAMTRDMMNLEVLRIWSEQKKTILFVTHSIYEAAFLADKIIALKDRPCRVREIINVDLPRPRALDVRGTSAYGGYVSKLYHLLQEESCIEEERNK